jgi:hypothetical protein
MRAQSGPRWRRGLRRSLAQPSSTPSDSKRTRLEPESFDRVLLDD